MFFRYTAVLFATVGLGLGQVAAPPPKTTTPVNPGTQTVAPDAVVITIKGLCAEGAKDCVTTITREEFEKIAKSVQPQMPQQWQRQFATAYTRLLILSAEAHKRGLESKPKTQAMMKLATMNVLAQQLTQALQEEATELKPGAIEKYYQDNQATYTRVDLLRLYIPAERQPEASAKDTGAPQKSPAEEKPASEETESFMRALASKLRERATAGEDFAKLQAEAFAGARLETTPPSTKLDKIARVGLPTNQRSAFDLKPGEVSELIIEPNGMYVYKMVRTGVLPLEEVRDDIKSVLQGGRFQELMQDAARTATPAFNDAYFGPEPTNAGGRKVLPLSPQPEKKK